MSKTLIRNARLVNEGKTTESDLLIDGGFIAQIGQGLSDSTAQQVIDANGSYLLPGVIDDQVHFREPGLTHKATIHTESRAAVAGGVTSFMEMPNTVPNALTQALLADKYAIAAQTSLGLLGAVLVEADLDVSVSEVRVATCSKKLTRMPLIRKSCHDSGRLRMSASAGSTPRTRS